MWLSNGSFHAGALQFAAMQQTAEPPTRHPGNVAEVVRYFFRLGCIAFGGPAAHIALMRRELVRERAWLTDAELMDMLGAANLIPGPNSTELAMHIGAKRAGWRGLWAGGFAFIFPAVAIVMVLAWAYVEYGATTAGKGIIEGVSPFILAVIVQAIWGLRTAAIKSTATLVIAAAAGVLNVAGANEIVLILGAGAVMVAWSVIGSGTSGDGPAAVWRVIRRRASRTTRRLIAVVPGMPAFFVVSPPGYSLGELFLVFLRIGAVLYGSGYVLAAFLQSEFVDQRHWLTNQQVVDAIAAGQFTPGPLFSSATFTGYLVGGWEGALAATAGIFLPSFVFVAVTHPIIPVLRRRRWTSAFLDGVNAAALAVMAVVTVTLGRQVLSDPFAMVLFAAGAVVLLRWNPNSAILVLAGAALGLGRGLLF